METDIEENTEEWDQAEGKPFGKTGCNKSST